MHYNKRTTSDSPWVIVRRQYEQYYSVLKQVWNKEYAKLYNIWTVSVYFKFPLLVWCWFLAIINQVQTYICPSLSPLFSSSGCIGWWGYVNYLCGICYTLMYTHRSNLIHILSQSFLSSSFHERHLIEACHNYVVNRYTSLLLACNALPKFACRTIHNLKNVWLSPGIKPRTAYSVRVWFPWQPNFFNSVLLFFIYYYFYFF